MKLGLACLVIVVALFASACTTVGGQYSAGPVVTKTDVYARQGETEGKGQLAPERPRIALTADILFKLLVAEIAAQRNQLDIAVENYLELARTTRDPLLISRATRIAIYARHNIAAKEAARLWAEVAPGSMNAHQALAVVAFRGGDTMRALGHFAIMLKTPQLKMAPSQRLWMIANLLSEEKNQVQSQLVLERLMAGYQDDPELLLVYAQILIRLATLPKAREVLVCHAMSNAICHTLPKAREVLEKALALAPKDDDVAMTYLSVLNKLGQGAKAVAWLEGALEKDQDNFSLRIFYARILIDFGHLNEAIVQFEMLTKHHPTYTDVLLPLGLLYLQTGYLDGAEQCFTQLFVDRDYADDASYYLGNIAEERDDWVQASNWYQSVSSGDNYFESQVRIGILLGRQSRIAEARSHLHQITAHNHQQKIALIQAEADVLIEVRRYQEAMNVYDESLRDKYDEDLLYLRAMLAEKMDRLDILESDLRAILVKDANNSQALNALGYTLADRTDRYDEALEYIERALEIKPDSHYILDSMGWVLYRQGRLDEAIEFLNRALVAGSNDPEIAAHLGEVLWVKGDRKTAQDIWDTALKAAPDDDTLRDVIDRFSP